MPADYKSAAAGLSLSSSPDSDYHHPLANKTPSAAAAAIHLAMDASPERGGDRRPPPPFRDDVDDAAADIHDAPPPAPWARGGGNTTTTNNSSSAAARRLSTPYSLSGRRTSSSHAPARDLRGQLATLAATSAQTARSLYRQSATLYAGLSPTQQFLVLATSVILVALTITLLVFSHKVWALLGPIAVSWRATPGGWIIIWLLTFIVAFPPLVGYSTACTVAGFVYGWPLGWPIVASATVAGSAAAFVASRTVFSGYVDRLVGADARFVALGQVLRRDGLGVLTLVRFCPLPYSLSNGFLATVPSVQPLGFTLATAIASPKLLVHVFVGSRLALLAEEGDRMGLGDRLVNYLSMAFGVLLGAGVGYFIYRRTMDRAAEIARGDAAAAGAGGGRPLEEGGRALGGRRGDYADEDGEGARLMDPNEAAALMVDDDDISLWDAAGDEDEAEEEGQGRGRADGRYKDEEEAVGGGGGGIRKGSRG